MAYLVFCTFDLKNANAADYQTAYADLEKIGLRKVHKGSGGSNVVIPTTAAMGEFDGTSTGNVVMTSANKFRAHSLNGDSSQKSLSSSAGIRLGGHGRVERGDYWYAAETVSGNRKMICCSQP